MIERISKDDLVDPMQIGWVEYREGDALLKVKVIRDKDSGRTFLSHVTAYRKGLKVKTVEYPNREVWKMKEAEILEAFKSQVGNDYYECGPTPHQPLGRR